MGAFTTKEKEELKEIITKNGHCGNISCPCVITTFGYRCADFLNLTVQKHNRMEIIKKKVSEEILFEIFL